MLSPIWYGMRTRASLVPTVIFQYFCSVNTILRLVFRIVYLYRSKEYMKKEFSVNLLLLLGLNLLVKPLYIFGIDVQVQNTIGPEQYGLFFSIFNYTLIFQILLEFGITNLVKRDISASKNLAPKYFSNLIGLKLILLLIYIFLTFAVGYFIGYNEEGLKILFIVLLIQIFLSFVSFMRAILAGIGAYRIDSLLSVMDKIIMILLLGVMLFTSYWEQVTLTDFLYVYLISVAITCFTAYLMLSKKIHLNKLTFRKKYLASFLRRAAPYALITFLMGVYGRIDAVFLERLLPDGDYQAGIYAAGFRLLDAYMMFALLFSNLLLPMLSTYLKDKVQMMNFLYFVLGLLMTFSIIGGISGFFYRNEIGNLLYHYSNDVWGDTLGLLMLCMIPIGLSIIMGASIMSLGKLKKQNLLFFAGVIMSIILNLILIPYYNSTGAALAALTVNSLIAIGQTVIFYSIAGVKPQILFYLKLFILLITCLFVFGWIHYLDLKINWIIPLITGFIITSGSAFLMGLLPNKLNMLLGILKARS